MGEWVCKRGQKNEEGQWSRDGEGGGKTDQKTYIRMATARRPRPTAS